MESLGKMALILEFPASSLLHRNTSSQPSHRDLQQQILEVKPSLMKFKQEVLGVSGETRKARGLYMKGSHQLAPASCKENAFLLHPPPWLLFAPLLKST